MTWKTTFDGMFENYDAQIVAAATGAGTPLPVPATQMKNSAEQIMVQAREDNPGTIVVGRTASLPAGYRLTPGASQVLSDNNYKAWTAVGETAGCFFTVMYVSGPK